MTNRLPETSMNKIARVAGLAYVLIIADALFTLIFVDPNYSSADITTAVRNIIENELLFRIGIAADIVMFALVIVLSVALYLLLNSIDKNLAMFALFFRFTEGILGAIGAILGGLIPLLLLNRDTALETEQLQSLVGVFLEVQAVGIEVVMIFMGLGGIIFCYLFYKSQYVPKILSLWGIITYFTMLALSSVKIFLPNLPEIISIALFTPGALFEIIMGLWLVLKSIHPR